jgi:hypothetical protein
MKTPFTFEQILKSTLVNDVIQKTFPLSSFEVIHRPGSYLIRAKKEAEDKATRIILLPPHGFTANAPDEVAPHPEVRKARAIIKGGVRPDNMGFIPLKNTISFQYYLGREVKSQIDSIYPKINGAGYKQNLKSSKEEFFAVQEDGTGFYHSLVNLSDEWVCIVLEKEFRLEKKPDLVKPLSMLSVPERHLMEELIGEIIVFGDELFSRAPKLIEQVLQIPPQKSVPCLIEMLNILETGKHEPCTVYAIILKISKRDKTIMGLLNEANQNKDAPTYYLQELIQKLSS